MMRSDTRFSLRPRRAPVAIAAATTLLLTSCAAVDNTPLAMHRPVPYFALNTVPGPVAGTVREGGSFVEENGCLVFKPAKSMARLTPVFPQGRTQLVFNGWQTLGLYLYGSTVEVGMPYRVEGAVRHGPGDGFALARPAPSACPSTYYVVQRVDRDLLAEAEAAERCRGVLICYSYRLDY